MVLSHSQCLKLQENTCKNNFLLYQNSEILMVSHTPIWVIFQNWVTFVKFASFSVCYMCHIYQDFVLDAYTMAAMDELPEEPCPLQIINFDGESHTFSLNVELLEKILLSEEVKDRKIMVVTVAGAFRQGKSFILNFFLRYLKAVESGGDQVAI